jgi:hypothetical protein
VADLRTRFIEDYAGGLLNIARQELSSTGEVLAQDGFVDSTTLFVEDGRGVKSGLRLGSSLAECVDPTTEIGLLNVRTADRTYAKIRDLKAFATAVASAQGALSDSVATSLTNLEGAFESLETDVETYRTQLTELIDNTDLGVGNLTLRVEGTETAITQINTTSKTISDRVTRVETTLSQVQVVTEEIEVSGSTVILANLDAGTVNLTSSPYYAITSVRTDVPAWVTIYTDSVSRGSEQRDEGDPALRNSGVVLDVVTSVGDLVLKPLPLVAGRSTDQKMYARVVNKLGSPIAVTVWVRYIPL